MSLPKLFSTLLLSLFTLSVNSLNAADILKGKFLFLNGDSITADVIEWKNDSVRIKHPYLLNECEIKKENLLEIKLLNQSTAKEDEADQKLKHTTKLLIKPRYKASNDNDTIRGELIQNDGKHITLKTSYAGQLNIQRSKILSIDINAHSNLLYSGPNSLEEWHNNLHYSSWTYKKGALYSNDKMGSISKDLKMPDRVAISFDQHWRNAAHIKVKLFSDDHKSSRPNNYYEFSIRHGSIYVKKYIDGRQLQMNAKQQNFQALVDLRRAMAVDKSAHYDLYIDKEKGIFHLFVNGSLINTYTDPTPTPKKFGTSLHLVSGTNSPMKILNLKMSEWSGNMPTNNDKEAFSKLKGEGQRILLKNGDAIIGKTGLIKDGLMSIETIFGPMKVRVNGMRTLDLSDTPEDGPKMYKGDIKLHYNEGGWIILKPITINGTKLKAYHQAFGEAEFNLNAFKKIDLHVYSQTHNRARVDDTW